MEETVWTGKISISASNPDNWSDGLPNSHDREGVIPENRYDYDHEPDWDIADFTILIRVEGEPAQITIGSNCYFNGECYAPQAIIEYVNLLTLDRPPPYPGGGYLGMAVDFPDTRESSSIIIAASDSYDKSRADRVCSGTDDDVEFQWANDQLSDHGGKISLLDGTYYHNTQVACSSNIHWEGQGDMTIIQAVEDGTNDDLFRIDGTATRTNISFTDMKFSGSGLTNYRDFIRVFSSGGDVSYLHFYNLTMDYARRSIATPQASFVFVDNCRFTNGQQFVIYTYCGTDIEISNVSFDTCDVATIITCNCCERLSINNVEALDCTEQVIDISGINGEATPFTKDVTINNVVSVNCGGLLLSQHTANPNVWAERVTVSNCTAYGSAKYSVIAGIFNDVTFNNIIIDNNPLRQYMSLFGNHIHMNNIQYLTAGRQEGIEIEESAEFPTLIDIKLSNVYVENVGTHPADPATYGYGNGIKITSTNNGSGLQLINCEVVGCDAHGIYIDNFDDVIVQGCRVYDNSLSPVNTKDGFNFVNIDDSIITDNISKGSDQRYAMVESRTGSEGNNIIARNRLETGTTGILSYTENAGNVVYEKHTDLLMDVLAVSATAIRSNEDLSAGVPITFTLDAQPDIPRTLSGHFDAHAQITAYTIDIVGVDAKGETVTETKTESDGWDWETSNAFATITSITMSARTGTGAGDTMDIGVTDVLGLSNTVYETSDVYKIKKNNANATVAGAQVNTTYHTYDMAVIGLAGADDFTIWFKTNLNIIS